MPPEAQTQSQDVPRETRERLETYHALLLKWQKAINLVSASTLEEAWQRHFVDSMQLAQYIPTETKTIADLGSGAGFPGLVLAIIRPDLEVHLVESDERKAQFLRTVSRETSAGCVIHNDRIENLAETIRPELITARALAGLTELCAYSLLWAAQNPALEMLFLKGAQADEEIAKAQKSYEFTLETHPSLTDPAAKILRLKALRALGSCA